MPFLVLSDDQRYMLKTRLALLLEVEKAIPIPEMDASRRLTDMKLQDTDKPVDLATKNNKDK